jgi:mannan endo-1,4-beta-mannosidase
LAVLGIAFALSSACASARSHLAPDCTRCAARGQALLWGAWFDDSVPWNMAPVRAFDELVGDRVSVVEFGAPFANCDSRCVFYKFPWTAMRNIWRQGAVPMLSWSSQSVPSSTHEPDFTLAAVIAGRYDSFIRQFARAAKRWGHPFFLRFDWEMNGNWFPWSERENGNRPGQFVAAWRHVHDIFTAVGASSVTWVWCPNVDLHHRLIGLRELYPGGRYVDWTCMDGYNFGGGPATGGWVSFDRLFRSTYREITRTVAPGKPMMIGETGTVGSPRARATWIARMFADLPRRFPDIHGVMWFQRTDGGDWPIFPGSREAAAFAAGIHNDERAGGAFCPRIRGPIAAPSSRPSAGACS